MVLHFNFASCMLCYNQWIYIYFILLFANIEGTKMCEHILVSETSYLQHVPQVTVEIWYSQPCSFATCCTNSRTFWAKCKFYGLVLGWKILKGRCYGLFSPSDSEESPSLCGNDSDALTDCRPGADSSKFRNGFHRLSAVPDLSTVSSICIPSFWF
jgi:hypothetical protein